MDWYEEKIEPKIRELVKKLRNNGINTFCSCEHEKYIECETYDSNREYGTIFNVLTEMGYKKFTIDFHFKFDFEPVGANDRYLVIKWED
jgi:hypothetical protein